MMTIKRYSLCFCLSCLKTLSPCTNLPQWEQWQQVRLFVSNVPVSSSMCNRLALTFLTVACQVGVRLVLMIDPHCIMSTINPSSLRHSALECPASSALSSRSMGRRLNTRSMLAEAYKNRKTINDLQESPETMDGPQDSEETMDGLQESTKTIDGLQEGLKTRNDLQESIIAVSLDFWQLILQFFAQVKIQILILDVVQSSGTHLTVIPSDNQVFFPHMWSPDCTFPGQNNTLHICRHCIWAKILVSWWLRNWWGLKTHMRILTIFISYHNPVNLQTLT